MEQSSSQQNPNPNSEIDKLLEDYLASLNPKELKAYHIAKSHLGMSFDLQKSNGFIEFKSTKLN